MSGKNSIKLDFPNCLQLEYPDQFLEAWESTQLVLQQLPDHDFSNLARHSPGLKNFQWDHYIRLSSIRMVRVGAALRRAGLHGGRILDFGSYFGNFALFARAKGFAVDAADSYSSYAGALDNIVSLLKYNNITTIDISSERSIDSFSENIYDAIFCLGVIEHIPHTPRLVLKMLDRLLKPGGSLIIDTPNLLYIYTRDKLSSGQSIFPQIESQFYVEPPFEGHHREYTSREVAWMLEAIGHKVAELELFNYSLYGLTELSGKDADYWRHMENDPEYRELILARSIKPL